MTIATACTNRIFTRDLLAMLHAYPYVSLLRNNTSVGYLSLSPDHKYVRVNYFGQYAVRSTHTALKNLFDTVLDDIASVTPAHYSEYHCNICPDDPAYTCTDLSQSHPNVYNK